MIAMQSGLDSLLIYYITFRNALNILERLADIRYKMSDVKVNY